MKARFQRKYLAIPYVAFLVFFVVIPLLLIVYYAFSDKSGALSFNALKGFFSSTEKIEVLLVSLTYSFLNTLICLLLAYPLAMILANKKYNKNAVIVMIFVMPMWINFVIRSGALRDILTWIGLSGGYYPEFATLAGMVYNYLPFAVLPLYTTMLNMDRAQLEASSDLGATPIQTFFKVYVPLTKPGIVSAILMIFMPTISSYVISNIMSERKVTLFGGLINQYFNLGAYNDGSFVALIMLILVALIAYFSKRGESSDSNARGSLW
ncbi:MAG: ABC transporter permease [Erysipelotrichaceae bacterium]|nr:ABC transporter permease [Erysipelotrichaceae bacterium]